MLRNRERTDIEKSQRPVERKSPPQRDIARKGAKSSNPIIRYFQETGDELRKVSWPTREETTRLTFAVVVVAVAIGLALGGVDLGLNWLVDNTLLR